MGTRFKLAQLRNFPPNVLCLHMQLNSLTSLDKFHQVVSLVVNLSWYVAITVFDCGRHGLPRSPCYCVQYLKWYGNSVDWFLFSHICS